MLEKTGKYTCKVICDRCGEYEQGGYQGVASYIFKTGWFYDKETDEAYCPDCIKEIKKKN